MYNKDKFSDRKSRGGKQVGGSDNSGRGESNEQPSDNPWKRAPKTGGRPPRESREGNDRGEGSEARKPGRKSEFSGKQNFEKKPYRKDVGGDRADTPERREGDSDRKPFKRASAGSPKQFGTEKREFERSSDKPAGRSFEKRPYSKRDGAGDAGSGGRKFDKGGAGKFDRKPFHKREEGEAGDADNRSSAGKPYAKRYNAGDAGGDRRKFDKPGAGKFDRKPRVKREDGEAGDAENRPSSDRPYAKRYSTGDAGGERRKFDKPGAGKFDRKPYVKREEGEKGEGENGQSEGKTFSKSFDRKGPGSGERRPSDKFKGKFGDKKFEKGSYKKKDDGQKPVKRFNKSDGPGKEKEGWTTWFDRTTKEPPRIKETDLLPPIIDPNEPPISKSLDEVVKVQEIRAPYAKPSERKTANKKNVEVVELKEERKRKKAEEREANGTAEDEKPLRKRVAKKTGRTADHDAVAAAAHDDAEDTGESMPLNKYIAHSGECSRRDAAVMVKEGKVKVNGELVMDPGYKVKEEDKVTIAGKKVIPQKGMVYILLNKPKGFITTNDDPNGRRTVMELVAGAGAKRLYPVGRLDRETTGLLLITNDGDLTQRMSHPSFETKKVYQVTLDKALTKADFEKIIAGLDLEDGKVQVDEIAYLEEKTQIGLEIHSGKNRIVRRIFESLGYVVEKLDRVMYAGLTKKNLPRGKWRLLTDREIVLLKHFKA